jgi:molybdate transport system regulatory protein
VAKSIRQILGKGEFTFNGKLWLEKNGKRFFGPGPIELLELIDQTGSINQAAKKMKISYKKAWEIVNNLNTAAAQPMVITLTGGEKGGGSSISEEAKQLIDLYRTVREKFEVIINKANTSLK